MRARHLLIGLGVLGGATCAPPGPAAGPTPAAVRAGIEVLLADSLHLVRGRRVGLLTNHTGVDRAGRRDVDLLRAVPGVRLAVLYSPEHGFRGTEDRPDLPDDVDSTTGLPIYSLYAGARPPNLAGLDSIDVLLIDLQDVGARYYTYVWYGAFLAREAATRGTPVIVLDRPNPLGGLVVQGNTREHPAALTERVGFLPVPMRHGMTLGELLLFANDVLGLGAQLSVVPAAGWRRAMYHDATGLPWIRPSPNLPNLESALHYPGLCLFEGTNLSVGRGTEAAFQVIGAPWLDPQAVLDRLRTTNGEALSGVDIRAVAFAPRGPADGKYDGVALRGVRLRVRDRARYDPPRTAVALLLAVRAAHPDSFRFRPAWFDLLAAGGALRAAIAADRAAVPWAGWDDALRRFKERRAKYLLY